VATLIYTDDRMVPLEDVSLPSLQAAVEGYIETVPLGDGRILIVNEEGKLYGLPHNNIATTFLTMSGVHPGDYIVGNAVLCEPGEIE